MALVVVTNVSNHLVTLRLNSGQTLILDPKVSSEMVEQEIQGNDKVGKLTDLGIISVQKTAKQSATEKADKKTSVAKGH
jgi:hypothetical protein